jgi:hypothetical protein
VVRYRGPLHRDPKISSTSRRTHRLPGEVPGGSPPAADFRVRKKLAKIEAKGGAFKES